uniref:Uncharacterized protein n=1 Tax=Rhizophora mucronata TaxID=61149 RepID=A0A2P2IH81_RHIMU
MSPHTSNRSNQNQPKIAMHLSIANLYHQSFTREC